MFGANVVICIIMYLLYRLNFAKISVFLLKYLQRMEEYEQELLSDLRSSSEEGSQEDQHGQIEFNPGTNIFTGKVDLEVDGQDL